MKTEITRMMVALVAMTLLIGCAANPALYRKLPSPVNKIVKAGPLYQIRIKAKPAAKVAVGQSVVLTATGVDENSREVAVSAFTWKSDAEGKLSATKGKSVTFTLLTKPSVACYVSAKANGEEGMIAIEGK